MKTNERAKEDYRIVDSYFLSLRRLSNLCKKKKIDRYAFDIIGKALYLGSIIAVKESEENYKKGRNADLAFEVKCLTNSLGSVCNLIRDGAKINTIGSKLEQEIEEINIDSIEIEKDNNRIFYVLTRNMRDKKLEKKIFYFLIGKAIRNEFYEGGYIDSVHSNLLDRYFDEKRIDRRMGIVGFKLLQQEDIIRKTLLNLLEPHLVRGE